MIFLWKYCTKRGFKQHSRAIMEKCHAVAIAPSLNDTRACNFVCSSGYQVVSWNTTWIIRGKCRTYWRATTYLAKPCQKNLCMWNRGMVKCFVMSDVMYSIYARRPLCFHSLEVVSRYKDLYLQVGENSGNLKTYNPSVSKWIHHSAN